MSSGVVMQRHTSATGASKMRSTVSGPLSGVNNCTFVFAAISLFDFVFLFLFLFGLQFLQIFIQPVKTLLPKAAIFLDPLLRLLHWGGVQFQPMHAAVPVALDESRLFQHPQMF